MLLLKTFDCFSDGIPRDLAKLDRIFPASKYVLQVRELEGWVCSRLAHIDRSRAQGYYRKSPGWDSTEVAVKSWITQRNDHHLFVLDYFSKRPGDLLVVNFLRDPNAGTRVANFLGFVGTYDRPEDNVNPERNIPDAYRAILKRSSDELNIPAEEWQDDIFCKSLVKSGSYKGLPADTGRLSS